ncbi:MAG: pyruvate kinase PykF [Succinivibrio sp.]|nr:pyruvate kinase PykF [Succinivibrio sp.]
MKKTKIVCTIGPKSEHKEVLHALLKAGMNVMRLNFSHGDYQEHGSRIDTLRELMAETGFQVPIMLDTKGPEIRTTTNVNGEDLNLVAGQKITLTTDASVVGTLERISVTYADLNKDVKVGDTVLLDDGLIALKVESIEGTEIHCEIQNNGQLGEHKGINLPFSHISMPFLSERDKQDLLFGIQKNVDYVAASFTRSRRDVLDIREFLDANGGQDIQIICKIENQEGIDNFEDILATCDAIMVARGDMGVEIPAQEVIFAQKHIIKRCNEVGKPVITATQMLDSMIKNPRPTRAEAGDVANAILDGTDAVMLSGESAKGKYPVEAVTTMSNICVRTDEEVDFKSYLTDEYLRPAVPEAVCKATVECSELLHSPLIVVATEHGRTARTIRKYFPSAFILALSPHEKVVKQLCLVRGVIPRLVKRINSTDEFFSQAIEIAKELGLAQEGEKIVLVNGALSADGSANTMSVHTL